MRVIKYGDKNLLKKIRRFKCKACGCEFEADNTEYKYECSKWDNCEWYAIECPTCGLRVTTDYYEETNV